MFKVEYYQVPKSKRWRWKWMYNHRVLARSETHYRDKFSAQQGFVNFAKGIVENA